MAAIAPFALVASTAMSAASSIIAGREKATQAAFEQQQYQVQQTALEQQERQYRIAADEAEARRRDELISSIGTIQALRAGRGVGEGSPTGMAILNNLIATSEGDIGAERLGLLTRADQARIGATEAGYGATLAGRTSRTSLLAGYLGAGEAVASGAFKYSRPGYYSPTTATG